MFMTGCKTRPSALQGSRGDRGESGAKGDKVGRSISCSATVPAAHEPALHFICSSFTTGCDGFSRHAGTESETINKY